MDKEIQFDVEALKKDIGIRHAKFIEDLHILCEKTDCEYAFLGIATDKLLHKSGEGYREAEHGTVPALIELAAFYLYPFFGKSDNRDSGNVSAISNLLEELDKIRGFATAFSVDYEDKELALLQVRAQLWAESVRGSAYPPQTRHRIERIQVTHE